MKEDPYQDVKHYIDDAFLDKEMEYEAKYTESAYISEHKPGPNTPYQPKSFVHSVIQQHIDERINTNILGPPIFSSKYYEYIAKKPIYDEETKSVNMIIDEVDRFQEEELETTHIYHPVETNEVLESECDQNSTSMNKDENPASKIINESGFEIKTSNNRNHINIEELIQEEMKLQEMKESTRSAANIVDDESSDDLTKMKNSIKNLVEEMHATQKKGQKFSIKARQVMEERYGQGQTLVTQNMPTLSKDMIEIRLFKKTVYYKAIEQAALLGEDLIIRDSSNGKFDLDSDDGQTICKNYLSALERFFQIIQLKTSQRSYRDKFSKAYKVLYTDDQQCYLTEILDSAQEGFPYLWVNGEKYVFSKDVLDSGQALFQHFCKLRNFINSFNKRLTSDEIRDLKVLNQKKQKLEQMLEQLDVKWTHYEQCYVFELMVIETDARRYIVEAIAIENQIYEYELAQKKKGIVFLQQNKDYNELREKFVAKMGEINAVANTLGKGRDDFKLDILLKAEDLSKKVSPNQSIAVRKLSDQIKQTLHTFRVLVRKYNENVEVVDPQLKNNQELVEVLNDWEKAWCLGKEHILDPIKCKQLIEFSQIIECAADKHKQFQEQIDCRDSDIFISIPSLLILKSLEEDTATSGLSSTQDKAVCKRFFPNMFKENDDSCKKYNELKQEYNKMKLKICGHSHGSTQFIIKSNSLKNGKSQMLQKEKIVSHKRSASYEFYNELEKIVLGQMNDNCSSFNSNSSFSRQAINEDLHKIQQYIKQLGMELQRHNPTEWNEFMTACLGSS